ncbi:MAG TPA: DUF1698 domain-containing protein [Pseudomonadales bacterium]
MSRPDTLQSDGATAEGPLAQAIRELGPWFHNLHLKDGTQTAPDHPLGDFPAWRWREVMENLSFPVEGLRVLDMGCNAGFHAFDLSRRGARVVAADMDEHYLAQARWASEHVDRGEHLVFRRASVYDVSRWDETWDLVLFQGVLYHLRYPLLALDVLAGVCVRWLIIQTVSIPAVTAKPPFRAGPNVTLEDLTPLSDPDWPRLAFIEDTLAKDPTNWWVPNGPALFAMLRSAGFAVRRKLAAETWLCERTDRPGGARLAFTL